MGGWADGGMGRWRMGQWTRVPTSVNAAPSAGPHASDEMIDSPIASERVPSCDELPPAKRLIRPDGTNMHTYAHGWHGYIRRDVEQQRRAEHADRAWRVLHGWSEYPLIHSFAPSRDETGNEAGLRPTHEATSEEARSDEELEIDRPGFSKPSYGPKRNGQSTAQHCVA